MSVLQQPITGQNPQAGGQQPVPGQPPAASQVRPGGPYGRIHWWNTKRFFVCLLAAFLITIIVAAICGVASSPTNSPDLSYNSLDYQAKVLDNGDIRISERIDVNLRERSGDNGSKPWRQLYQRYMIQPSNLTGISDISVRNVTEGHSYKQSRPMSPAAVSNYPDWDERQAGKWYIAKVDDNDLTPYRFHQEDARTIAQLDGQHKLLSNDNTLLNSCENGGQSCQVEIGWNIPSTLKADSLVFELSMTFHDAASAYDDANTVQWEPLGQSNQIPIGQLTGHVQLPSGSTKGNTKAWLHFTGPSKTWREADGSLRFQADEVKPGQYLDLVAVYPLTRQADGRPQVSRVKQGQGGKALTLKENTDEDKWRSDHKISARVSLTLWSLGMLLAVLLAGFVLYRAFRSYGLSQYRGEVQYWREPPAMSPAAAAAVATVIVANKSGLGGESGRQLSSTVLSLASKKAIILYPGPASSYQGVDLAGSDARTLAQLAANHQASSQRTKSTTTIAIQPVVWQDRASLKLSSSQEAALAILEEAATELHGSVFDVEQMKTVLAADDKAVSLQENFHQACSAEFGNLAATKSFRPGWAICSIIVAIVVWIIGGSGPQSVLSFLTGAVLLLAATFAVCYGKDTVLTDRGQYWAGQVQGFRNYLVDFSSFEDRGVQDLILWDQYLVYASALGISQEAVKQLALAYPQLTDPEWLDSQGFGLLYSYYRPWSRVGGWSSADLASHSFGTGFGFDITDLGGQLTSSFTALQTTIAAASGSSSDGSFSGGGFGGSSGGSGGGSFGGR